MVWVLRRWGVALWRGRFLCRRIDGDAQFDGEAIGGDLQGDEEFFAQHFAGMDGLAADVPAV